MTPEVLSERARSVRRMVGPTSWVVLEELLAGADWTRAGWVVCSNVRRLAGELGLSKDTVAKALRRLVAVGVIERRAGPRGGDGRFTTVSYVIAGDVFRPAGPTTRAPKTRALNTPAHPQLFPTDTTRP